MTVSGIGPRVAMTVLSTLPPDKLRAAIVREDVAVLTRVPGIGPKMAKKLAFELKDRLAAEAGAGEAVAPAAESDADLVAALTGLGYSVAEAQQAIRALPAGHCPSKSGCAWRLHTLARESRVSEGDYSSEAPLSPARSRVLVLFSRCGDRAARAAHT